MRGHEHVGQPEQRVMLGEGLGRGHVEDRRDPPSGQLRKQRVLVDERGSSSVNERCAIGQCGELRGSNHAPSRFHVGSMNAKYIDHAAQRGEIVDLRNREVGGSFDRQERIEDEHVEGVGAQQLDG